MNDPRSPGPRPVAADGGNDAAVRLLRESNPRQPVPPEILQRSRGIAHRAWREAVRRRRRFLAGWVGLAAAAALTLAVGGDFVVALTQRLAGAMAFGSDAPVAVLEVVTGSAPEMAVANRANRAVGGTRVDSQPSLALGEPLVVGAEVATDADARAAFRLAGGQSLRMGAGTRLRWLAEDVVLLEQGAVYIDSQPPAGDEPHPEPIEVRTAYGSATDIGTQFEVHVGDGALRVRVREGRVQIDQRRRSLEAAAGSEWTLHDGGRVSRRSLAAHDEAWQGYLEVAPPFELEGSRLDAFLRWVARETGWSLAYVDPAIELAAPGITLHGSLAGIPADQAHELVLETCGLRARLEDGILLIDSRPTR